MKKLLPILLIFVPTALLYVAGALEFLERRWMDAQFQITQRPARSDILLVDIDPRSLQTLGVWPWTRSYHATVLDELLEAGAERVAFDIDFSSRSTHDPEGDQELASSLAEGGSRVVLPIFQQWQHSIDGAYLTTIEPLPEFAGEATLGSINIWPESDGLVRRYVLQQRVDGKAVPALAAALAAAPEPSHESYYVDFGVDPQSFARLSYIDVLMGQFEPSVVRGKAVIVGSTAVELGDQIAVPISAALPGPLLQALAYESLTQDRTLQRAGKLPTLAVTLLIVLVLAPVFESASWRQGLLMTLIASCCALMWALAIQTRLPVILETAPWLLSLVGLYGYSLVQRIDQQNVRLLVQRLTLRRTESLMRHVVANSFDAIVTVDARGSVRTFNPAAQKMFGYAELEIVGTHVHRLFPHGRPTEPDNPLDTAEGTPRELSAKRRDGTAFPVELVVTGMELNNETRVAFFRDITERKHQQRALEHQATHDPLTNLPNRNLLRERINDMLAVGSRTGGSAAVLLLDLDRFKEINDALGHHTGDMLLQQVARRLEDPLDENAVLARLGGDEFAILLTECEPEHARETARDLIRALRQPFDIDGLALQVDTSIGVTVFPDHGKDAQTLLRHADVAMYVAKRKRCGYSIYDSEEDFNSLRNLTLRGDLRRAVEQGELNLVYQPKILARTNQIVGVEALVRWNHATHGQIPPDEFIGLAEHGGVIQLLTEWVCRTALDQGARWREQGVQLNISVNLSARNLLEEDLPETMERLLEASRMPSRLLTLEITESVIMEDPERAMRVVTRLRELGISISLDDFGTGYSSLAYLMKLPAQELKIDKSFVMQMERDPGSAMIVHSTIDLAHNLGLKVVAEGVEQGPIWRVLCELGCDYGQGYFFSRPVPPDDLLALVRDNAETTEPALESEVVIEASDLDPGPLLPLPEMLDHALIDSGQPQRNQ